MKILTIDNKAGKIKLDENVDEYSRKRLAEEISQTFGARAFADGANFGEMTNAIDNGIDTLDIEIHSPGGSVFDGFVIYNELLALRKRGVCVTATINTLAASMASVIAMAADNVRIVPNGKMMIHDVSCGCWGNAKDLSRMADLCEQMSNEIADIYAKKCGATTKEMRDKMLDETWLNAQQAIELGLADELFDIGATNQTVTNMNLIDRLTNPASAEALEQIKALEAQIADTDAAHALAVEKLQSDLATAETALQEAAGFKAQLDEANTKLVDVQAKLDDELKARAELESALLEAKESASKLAVEIAASAGITKPIDIENENDKVDHFKAMENMSPADRTAYFRANKKEILAQR